MTVPYENVTHINVYLDPNANFNDPAFGVVAKETGKPGLETPSYIVLFYELGGEAYLKYGDNSVAYPRLATVDYENLIRGIIGLPLRGYDFNHNDDPRNLNR